MSVTERVLALYSLLDGARSGLTLQALTRELNCDVSSFHRARRKCEEHFGVVIRNERKYGTYHLDKTEKVRAPGLWFRPEELAGLLALSQWMESLGTHVLRDRLDPIRADLEAKLRARGVSPQDWVERIRVLPMHLRAADPRLLLAAADAVLRRQRLCFEYRKARDSRWRLREVSPQALVHYRDTWYLDAFDDEAGALRSFALHRMREMKALPEAAVEVPRAELDAHFADGYGIFGGAATDTAVLLFEGEAARIVGEEQWHPKETRRILPDGRLRLEFPCGRVEELARDVLRFAGEVAVEGPKTLQEAVDDAVRRAYERMKMAGNGRKKRDSVKIGTVR